MNVQLDGGLTPPHHGPGRILVVDAAREWRQFVRHFVEEAGFEVVTCNSATEATMLFNRRHPDLVLLGSDLADMTAVALCAWFRERSDVPIVVVNDREPSSEVALLEAGADLVLPALIGRLELVARLRAALRRTPPRDRTEVEVVAYGGMKLNRLDGRLELEGRTVHLEGRSLALMDLLLRNGGNVTPRRALQDELSIGESELDGHVRRLRDHLEPIESWRRIVTVRGVGFRLLEDRSEVDLTVNTRSPEIFAEVVSSDRPGIGTNDIGINEEGSARP